MAYKNKTYIAFDGDNDIHYYYLMKAWKHNQRDFFADFDFYDVHMINTARDSSQEESVKAQLRTRFQNTKIFVLLIGQGTKYLYKFVRWEIEQALNLKIPIICINLNGKRQLDPNLCPSILQSELAIHISFSQKIIEYALNHWEGQDKQFRSEGKKQPYLYNESVYRQLDL